MYKEFTFIYSYICIYEYIYIYIDNETKLIRKWAISAQKNWFYSQIESYRISGSANKISLDSCGRKTDPEGC